MHKGIFSRLAKQNIRNNKSTYIPYIITCIFCIAMIYMMEFLRDCPTLDQAVRQADEVRMIVFTGEIVVEIFCIIFLIYSNSFLMKRRQKEIGLYNILGLERNHIGIVMFLETIITSIGSLAGGIAAGIIGSKLALLLLLKLLHIPSVLGFYISVKGIFTCLFMFGIIFLMILFLNLAKIHLSRPVELLRGNNTGEKEPVVKWLMALIGFICLSNDTKNAPALWNDKYEAVYWMYGGNSIDLCCCVWVDLSYDGAFLLSYCREKIIIQQAKQLQ